MKVSPGSFLKVSDVCVEENGVVILQDISFTQQQFQKIAIAGETGSGKSTLLQCIAGLVQPAGGEILFEGKKVEGPHEVMVAGHPEIAYLSQQYELPRFLRVEQVLQYANILTHSEAASLYDLCRISHLLKRKTNQLSGGERQRIALAKLLISSPSMLLLDEPYSNLDVAHKRVLKSVTEDISDQLDITCILISHDPADTLSWADEIMIMKEGRMLQKGTPKQIYQQPINVYAASLFGGYNLIPAPHAEHLGKEAEDKMLLIRPENVSFAKKGKDTLKGTVNKISFFGSYYEVEVLVDKTPVTVRCRDCNAIKGNEVYLSFPSEGALLVDIPASQPSPIL